MYIVITTCATSQSNFATSIYNTCNIPLKHLKHLKYTLATCASQGMSTTQRTPRCRRRRRPPFLLTCEVDGGTSAGACLPFRDGGKAQDGDSNSGVASDGAREQSGMGRSGEGCGGRVCFLQQGTLCRYVVEGERRSFFEIRRQRVGAL
jgi:hypothetical protein